MIPTWLTVILTVMAIVIAIVIVVILVVRYRAKQRKLDEIKRAEYALAKPFYEFRDNVHRAEYGYALSRLIPPEGASERHDMVECLAIWQASVDAVKARSELLIKIRALTDPIEKRDRLYETIPERRNSLPMSPSDYLELKAEVKKLTKAQAKDLWAKSQEGDTEAMVELIALTCFYKPYQSATYWKSLYHDYTDTWYKAPKGWQEVVAGMYDTPSYEDLRLADFRSHEVLDLAAAAIRESSVTKGKIILAFWNHSEKYQHLIPQEIIAPIVLMVEQYRHNKTTSSKQVTAE